MDIETDIGPMVNQKQLDKVLKYIAIGREQDKATLVYGGERCEGDGYFVSPAIFIDCHDQMQIVRDEVFGMLMSILTFEDEDEVLQRANATPYGLSAGLFTSDLQRAHRLVHRWQAGTTWINNYNLAPAELPWGGYRHSGLGRENGLTGIESWT